jgi:putative ABC transport system permease protein
LDWIWLRWIVRELAAHTSRTALTVLSIAVGLFAVSLTFRTQAILSHNVLDSYRAAGPAAIVVRVRPADPELAASLQRLPGVRAVEAVRHLSARALVGTEWRALAIYGVDDLGGMQVNRLVPERGAWPPPRRTIALERSYLESAGAQPGQALTVEVDDGRQFRVAVAGVAHDRTMVSGRLGSPVLQSYATLDTTEWLAGSRDVNEFYVAVDARHGDQAGIRAVADAVQAKLESAGCTVVSVVLRDPSVPETHAIITAVFQTLGVLGVLSLVLSAALVVNTVSTMLTRHVPQIGVLKAVGARASNVLRTYLAMVLLFALMAMLVALPAAALCAWLLANQLAWLLNYDVRDANAPLGVVAVELAAGIGTPLLASVFPVSSAAGVTVREPPRIAPSA